VTLLTPAAGRSEPRFRYQLAAFALTRTIINTCHRLVYPFLPAIARGLGVSLASAALAVTARATLGLAGPVLGSVADTRGRRPAMLLGLGLIAAGMFLIAGWQVVAGFTAGLLLVAAGKIVFESGMYAYVGDRVPYRQRGLATAVAELGWSGAFLFGIPVAGWLIQRGGWSAPFSWIALAALACAGLLVLVLPAGGAPTERRAGSLLGSFQLLKAIASHPGAMAGLALGLFMSAGNETVSIVFGAWMEQSFGLPVAAIGGAAAVIGFAELSGEGLVAVVVDRLGKKRSVAVGAALSAAASLALPQLGRNLPGALLGLFLVFLAFEFTIVGAIPLMTELVPAARGSLVSANIAAYAAGRVAGALLGPALFPLGMWANGAAAAGLHLLGLAALVLFVREDFSGRGEG
jgi:predicted MFS family arabinose efflux permease